LALLELNLGQDLAELSDFLQPENLTKICSAERLGAPAAARGLSTDTRTLQAGQLFVALRGDNFDGHDHLQTALEKGAVGLIVEQLPETWKPEVLQDVFVLVVEDCRRALGDIAGAWRRHLGMKVVAITGSCGKTTTKEMLRQLLEGHYSLVASQKSFNNDIGLPMTLLRCTSRTEVCILELGTNHKGEIARLAEIAAPDLGILTMIGQAHLEGFGDREGVLREKGALLDALPKGGTAILGCEVHGFGHLVDRARRAIGETGDVLCFGSLPKARFQASHLRPMDGPVHASVAFDLEYEWRGQRYHEALILPRPGLHDVRNLLAALAAASALGTDPQTLLTQVSSILPPPRRLEAKEARSGAILLDDSYNANPESLLAALSVLDSWQGVQRRILVLGDMLELGPDSARIHAELGEGLLDRVDLLITVGPLAAQAARPRLAKESQMRGKLPGESHTRCFQEALQVLPLLQEILHPGDLVLFKASRGVALDRLVDPLL